MKTLSCCVGLGLLAACSGTSSSSSSGSGSTGPLATASTGGSSAKSSSGLAASNGPSGASGQTGSPTAATNGNTAGTNGNTAGTNGNTAGTNGNTAGTNGNTAGTNGTSGAMGSGGQCNLNPEFTYTNGIAVIEGAGGCGSPDGGSTYCWDIGDISLVDYPELTCSNQTGAPTYSMQPIVHNISFSPTQVIQAYLPQTFTLADELPGCGFSVNYSQNGFPYTATPCTGVYDLEYNCVGASTFTITSVGATVDGTYSLVGMADDPPPAKQMVTLTGTFSVPACTAAATSSSGTTG